MSHVLCCSASSATPTQSLTHGHLRDFSVALNRRRVASVTGSLSPRGGCLRRQVARTLIAGLTCGELGKRGCSANQRGEAEAPIDEDAELG